MSCVLVVVMPAISILKRQRTENWELQVGKLSKNRRYVSFSFAFFFFCSFILPLMLQSYLSLFHFSYCGYDFTKSLILKSSLRFFFTYLDSQIVGNGNCVPVSTCHPHLWTCSYHVWMHLHLCWAGECSDRQCLQGTLLPSAWMPSSKTIKKRDDSFNTFFSYIDSGKHVPRAVYVELIVIDKICTGTYHQLLHTEVQQLSITMPMATIPSPRRSLTLSWTKFTS